jgi:2'-5' RNA ligase
VPYAVTLPLDDAAAAHVERIWRALADRAGDNDAIRLGYTPHITLAVLPDTSPTAEIEEAAFSATKNWEGLPAHLAGFGVFPETPPTIWVAPVVTERLLARHASLHAALTRFSVHPHYRPGAWVPQVTLSKNGQSSAARAVEIATSVWQGPISARLERIDLVRFRPVEVLRSEILNPCG